VRESGLPASRRATASVRVRRATANRSLLGGGAAAATKEREGRKKRRRWRRHQRLIGEREIKKGGEEAAKAGSRGVGRRGSREVRGGDGRAAATWTWTEEEPGREEEGHRLAHRSGS